MAIGERIRFIRNLRGITQKYLGMAIGFNEKAADVRVAQYESGTRTPKENLVSNLAHVLDVSPHALTVPDIDSYIGLMHTLFALEDLYGLRVGEIDGEICLRLDKHVDSTYDSMFRMLNAWHQQRAKLDAVEITKEEYDQWRYRYPEFDTTEKWVKTPSKELSDMLIKEVKSKHKKLPPRK